MMMFSEIIAWLNTIQETALTSAKDCFISRAEVYQEDINFSNAILYVSDAGNYNPNRNSAVNLLVICDDVTINSSTNGIAVLNSKKNAESLCRSINAEIDRRAYIDHALSKLMDMANAKDFLERVIDYLYNLFGNPIAYFDYTHTVRTYREEGPTGVYIWDHSMENRNLDPNIVDEWFLKTVQFMVDTKQTSHTLFNEKVDYYACPVMHHETLFGFICILAIRGPLAENELNLLHKTADFVALVYNRLSHEAGNGDCREIIKDILDDKIKDERELQVRMISRNWGSNKRYQLIAIDLANSSEEYTQYVLEGIDGISGNIKKLVHNHFVLVLLENSYRKNEVLAYVERYELAAGVSDVFDRVLDIKTQFAKAKQALYIGRMLGHKLSIFNFSEYRFIDMLYAFQSAVSCETYYHPIVGELELYDKKNKTEFSKTLLAYLEHGKSVHKASEALNLHKNTVNYRVQRIKELFDFDYDNDSDINHIFLSLKIKEFDDIIHAR
jgi:PucR family transcriptional regulator, proline-responsive transcriptional activator